MDTKERKKTRPRIARMFRAYLPTKHTKRHERSTESNNRWCF